MIEGDYTYHFNLTLNPFVQSVQQKITNGKLRVNHNMQRVNFWKSTWYPPTKMHLILLYRYISLILTSFFFLIGPPQSPLLFKIGVVTSLTFASWILTVLQRRYKDTPNILKTIVLTEIISLTILLLFTGGITSPFIWYAFNPILIAASLLTPLISWSILTFYLASATMITYTLYDLDNILSILQNNSYIYLVCLLTTFLVLLFSSLTKELISKATNLTTQQQQLQHVNNQLSETNEMYKTTLEHIMSLYPLMDHLNKRPDNIADEMAVALITCMQKQHVFCFLIDLESQQRYVANKTNDPTIENQLQKNWHHLSQKEASFFYTFNQTHYWIKVIRTSTYVGVQGIEVKSEDEMIHSSLLQRTFEFIAELCECLLERRHIEEIKDELLIIEEQNRIANEIHDSVSQKLFSIVYSLHSLQHKKNNLTTRDLNEQYRLLSNTANSTIKELRGAIYRLSSVKKGDKPFILLVKNYLEEYSKLTNVTIDFQMTGNEALLSSKLKTNLYRIICEACGNAVRHGECSVITVQFSISDENTSLIIHDNGIGFAANKKKPKEKGIGMVNMKNIVHSFGGHFTVASNKKDGTMIRIHISHYQKITV